MPSRWADWPMPTSGARRFRSTSTASALIGEIYNTRHRWALAGGSVNMIRLMHQRNAARVLPVPGRSKNKCGSPRAIAGHSRS